MLPVLLDLKFIKIYTFGIFLVLAFFWGSFSLWKNIRLTSHKEEEIFDGVFTSLLGGLFFSRFIYVLFNFKDFGFNFLKFILINGYPGLSLYGFIIGGIFSLYLYLSGKKIKFDSIIDYFISSFFLALAFGKLGSFFSGVEVGTKTKFFLSVKYLGYDGYRHITPFYEALLFFLAASISQKLIFEIRKEKYSHGFIFKFFIWVLALANYAFDQFKANKLFFLGRNFDKDVSFFLLLTFSLYFIYYFRSFIGKGFKSFINYLKKHGQKIIKTVHRKSEKETGKR
jgi:phosphatidylglycerol---prolipoprotein diacylglyceryl transferase